MIQFSRVVAVEYAPLRVRVNTVVPGQLHTPMVKARLAGQRAGGNAPGVTWTNCCNSALRASRWGSWATGGTRPMRHCFWLRTKRD